MMPWSNMMKVSSQIIELSGETPPRVVREVILSDDDASAYEGYPVTGPKR